MIIDKFKVDHSEYEFKVIYNFWAEPVIEVFENSKIIGMINNRYSIEEAKTMMQNNSDFKRILIL